MAEVVFGMEKGDDLVGAGAVATRVGGVGLGR